MFSAMSPTTDHIAADPGSLFMASFDANLRDSICRHLRGSGMSRTGFGRHVLSDPGFAARYLDGRTSVRLDTADRIRTFVGDIPFRPVFLAEIEGFVELTGIGPWAVGHCATRQSGFVARLRAGASPWLTTIDRVRCWIQRQLPPGDRRSYLDGIAEATGFASQSASGGAAAYAQNGERRMTTPPKLMTTAAAADYLGLSPRTLERYRVTGGGPRFRKIGRWVRYVPADLANWLDDCARVSTSDDGRAAKER